MIDFFLHVFILVNRIRLGFDETSPAIDLNKKLSKMSDIELTNSTSSELSAGFSTPPSSSLDTCDSGFNDLYSNSFTLISSASSKSSSRTTPAQIDQSDSSPESAQLFDDNSITATESQNTTPRVASDDEQTGAATAVDRPPPPSSSSSSSYTECSSVPINEAQLDLNSLDYEHTTNACVRDTTMANNKGKYSGDRDADDYNDDSNMSDISDLSDVFKLNSDIMPEMQRSIDWVSIVETALLSFIHNQIQNHQRNHRILLTFPTNIPPLNRFICKSHRV